MKRASIFTLGHEAGEEQDAERNPLGDPKRKHVVHVHLMTTSIYLHALEYSLPFGRKSNATGGSYSMLCPIVGTQRGTEGPRKLRPSKKQLTLECIKCPRRGAEGSMGATQILPRVRHICAQQNFQKLFENYN